MNRIETMVERMEKQIAGRIRDGLTTKAKVAATGAALDMKMDEYVKFQELKSLAVMKGLLSPEEGQQVYAYLGTTPMTFNAQPVHVKAVLTRLFGKLLQRKIARMRSGRNPRDYYPSVIRQSGRLADRARALAARLGAKNPRQTRSAGMRRKRRNGRRSYRIAVWRKPTKGEIKFGYGSLHYRTITVGAPPRGGQKFKIDGQTWTYGSRSNPHYSKRRKARTSSRRKSARRCVARN